jgi:hypothetical protein
MKSNLSEAWDKTNPKFARSLNSANFTVMTQRQG